MQALHIPSERLCKCGLQSRRTKWVSIKCLNCGTVHANDFTFESPIMPYCGHCAESEDFLVLLEFKCAVGHTYKTQEPPENYFKPVPAYKKETDDDVDNEFRIY